MEFKLVVASGARKDFVLKRLEKMKKEVKRWKQISWIFSQKFEIVIEVQSLDEARTICEQTGCDFEKIGLSFSEV